MSYKNVNSSLFDNFANVYFTKMFWKTYVSLKIIVLNSKLEHNSVGITFEQSLWLKLRQIVIFFVRKAGKFQAYFHELHNKYQI